MYFCLISYKKGSRSINLIMSPYGNEQSGIFIGHVKNDSTIISDRDGSEFF